MLIQYTYQAGTLIESIHITCLINHLIKAQIQISPKIDKVIYSESLYFKRFHPKERLSMYTLYVELHTLYKYAGIKDLRELAKLAVEELNQVKNINPYCPITREKTKDLPSLRSY